jgi:hypothetical protein
MNDLQLENSMILILSGFFQFCENTKKDQWEKKDQSPQCNKFQKLQLMKNLNKNLRAVMEQTKKTLNKSLN